MIRRAAYRIRDIKKSIARIKSLLSEKSFEQMQADEDTLAAFERYLEILSEAARHLPEEWKAEQAGIPWRRIGDLGNQMRHEYYRVNAYALWSIYTDDLAPLDAAIDAMLAAHGGDAGE
jgi:uncharacterized protein with HEPN domain